MSDVIVPMDKARAKIFKAMTPATQAIANEFSEDVKKASLGVVLIQYRLGAKVAAVVEDEGTYGSGAVKQLAEFLGNPGGETYLYALKNFATTFDKDYVKQKSSIAMANGQHLTVTHWLHLMKLEEEKAREKMLKRVYEESISASDLEKEIRAGAGGKTKNARQGGRKPKTPSNPMVGLQQIFALDNKLVRFFDVAEKSVFDALDEIAADKVTDNLVERTENALKAVTEANEKTGEMKERLETNLERLKEIREKAGEEAAQEYDEEEAGGKKAKKKDKAKAESDDAGERKAKKKKKKNKRPVAAE
jgi:hypothetical protein